MSQRTLLVTGSAGFIGTNFIRNALNVSSSWHIVNLDALAYAGNPASFEDLSDDLAARHVFVYGDIRRCFFPFTQMVKMFAIGSMSSIIAMLSLEF